MSDADRRPYWQRRPYRSQVILLMLLPLAPFVMGVSVWIVLLVIQLLREVLAP
jgi:hypothetical protein